MDAKQPEALRLADELDTEHVYGVRQGVVKPAAAELRRLHAVNAELVEQVRISIGNVRSLGPSGALDGIPYAPYLIWLAKLVDVYTKATATQSTQAAA